MSLISSLLVFVLFISVVVGQLLIAVTDEYHQDTSESSRESRQLYYPRPPAAAIAAPYLFADPWGASPVRPPGIRHQPNINPFQQQFNPYFRNYIYRQLRQQPKQHHRSNHIDELESIIY